jgi:hypothetical protein
MEIEILAHGNTSPDKVSLLENSAQFYAKYLNIQDFKYKVFICVAPKMRLRDGNNGIASKTGRKEVTIAVDSQLALPQLLKTLAHEMIHAKQYMRGHYKAQLSRNGRFKKFWLGKSYSVEYLKRPWEIEAFGRENELVCALIDTVAQKAKKKKSST